MMWRANGEKNEDVYSFRHIPPV